MEIMTPLGFRREKDVHSKITTSKMTGDAYSSNWQEPPVDMMDMILQHMKIRDRIRLSTICKYWKSVVMRTNIHSCGKHEVPWLLLPQHSSNNDYLSFLSLSDANIYKLLLPRTLVEGASWVVVGSSKGWLIMAENIGQDSHAMFLVNPLSRAQHQLPSLTSIPEFESFKEFFVDEQSCAALIFCHQVVLSTSDIDSEDCLVAAVFDNRKTLALCRPRDKSWTIGFEIPSCTNFPENEDQIFEDVLFSASGVLHTLILYKREDPKSDMFAVTQSTINFGDHHVVELNIVHDEYDVKNYLPRLLESTTDNHVLLIHQMRKSRRDGDWQGNEDNNGEGQGNEDGDGEGNEVENEDDGEGQGNEDAEGIQEDEEGYQDDEVDDGEVGGDENGDGEGPDHDDNDVGGDQGEVNGSNRILYWKGTKEFKIYKLDPKDNSFIQTQCLGDQMLFLADVGSLSLPATHHNKELERNCITFATSTIISMTYEDAYYSHELGVFNLKGGRIEQSFPSIDMSVQSQLESLLQRDIIEKDARKLRWFTPSV